MPKAKNTATLTICLKKHESLDAIKSAHKSLRELQKLVPKTKKARGAWLASEVALFIVNQIEVR